MCYILYGAQDKSIDQCDYETAHNNSAYRFNIGTRHDIKMSIVNDSYEFRVTNLPCDCDFPVGKGDKTASELMKLGELILALKESRNANCIYIAKAWAGKRTKKEQAVDINNINIVEFLATMELDCLYRINF